MTSHHLFWHLVSLEDFSLNGFFFNASCRSNRLISSCVGIDTSQSSPLTLNPPVAASLSESCPAATSPPEVFYITKILSSLLSAIFAQRFPFAQNAVGLLRVSPSHPLLSGSHTLGSFKLLLRSPLESSCKILAEGLTFCDATGSLPIE